MCVHNLVVIPSIKLASRSLVCITSIKSGFKLSVAYNNVINYDRFKIAYRIASNAGSIASGSLLNVTLTVVCLYFVCSH